ncbi:MAG: type II toxin-antitoxin system mRNA interferase toxin, RelE/StbE family [bacterium]
MSKTLVWNKSFVRAFKRTTARDRYLQEKIFSTLELLSANTFHTSLNTHKLKGELDGLWACSVDYYYRIVFELSKDKSSKKEFILLIDIGTHDEVY